MEFERPSELRVKLELTPLIDVIFQLLVFFMLSSNFIYPSIELQLPELVDNSPTVLTQKLVITVDKNGKYYLNTTPVTEETLLSELQRWISEIKDLTLFIRMDYHVPYGKFLTLLSTTQQAGVKNYQLLYEPPN